jgi:predicted transcriptional regulator
VEQAELAWEDALDHAIRAGELLIEAKELVKHGEWMNWVKENFPGSHDLANKYMRLAANSERVMNSFTMREALAALSPSKEDQDQSQSNGHKDTAEDELDPEQVQRQARSTARRMTGDHEVEDEIPLHERPGHRRRPSEVKEPQESHNSPPAVIAVQSMKRSVEMQWAKLTGDYLEGFDEYDIEEAKELVTLLQKVVGNLKAKLKSTGEL